MIIEIIRKYIQSYGKSRYQLSRKTGVGEDQLCRIMQGKTCTLETTDKLCNFFKLKLIRNNKVRTHKHRDGIPTATFEELNFKEQAQSITAKINTLERMINNHIKRAKEENRNVADLLKRRLEQVQRMINRMRG
ncbi:MAG: helix-turn-helix domain-containing protein [Planctomycetes bacterium]|nr:helix-turn-helix domain-containing protein [Planctomycetota bacterium]